MRPIGFKHSELTKQRMRGKKRTDEMKQKYRLSKLGDKNSMWKGNEVGYIALHLWIRSRLPKPNNCQQCGKENKYLDLACVTGEYTRDFTNWMYLCRSCHMRLDGRINNLRQYQSGEKIIFAKKF